MQPQPQDASKRLPRVNIMTLVLTTNNLCVVPPWVISMIHAASGSGCITATTQVNISSPMLTMGQLCVDKFILGNLNDAC
ncbi:hypothetical protein Y032_0005g2583 [Ancylostoma ceylanicum]|uniref:Uncharacterized protein n=1 Tax=Ancylostoma ceylanicum TaxID=53326 RepID=A0A016VTE6_9BILA|nr:hypothetical protein Y032_0005g2583 [Ancylostoma ceylanicum]